MADITSSMYLRVWAKMCIRDRLKTNKTTKIIEEDTYSNKDTHNSIVRTGAMQAKLKKLNKHPYLFFKDAIKNIGVKTKKIIINAKGSQIQ